MTVTQVHIAKVNSHCTHSKYLSPGLGNQDLDDTSHNCCP